MTGVRKQEPTDLSLTDWEYRRLRNEPFDYMLPSTDAVKPDIRVEPLPKIDGNGGSNGEDLYLVWKEANVPQEAQVNIFEEFEIGSPNRFKVFIKEWVTGLRF